MVCVQIFKQANPDDPDVATLTAVPNLENITAIAAGDHTSFAVSKDGTLYSWGQGTNMLGQVSLVAFLVMLYI